MFIKVLVVGEHFLPCQIESKLFFEDTDEKKSVEDVNLLLRQNKLILFKGPGIERKTSDLIG